MPITLATRLEKTGTKLCLGFHEYFVNKREAIFQNVVTECARKNTNVHGLISNECQHYLKRKEQSFRKRTVKYVIKTLKLLVERQQDEEVGAI